MSESEWNSDLSDLIDKHSNIDLALIICCNDLCTNNSTRITSEWRDDISTSYLIQLRCTECDIEWMVCKHCCLKKKLFKSDQIRSHKWKYHERKRKAVQGNDVVALNSKKIATGKYFGNNNENEVNGNNKKTHDTLNKLNDNDISFDTESDDYSHSNNTITTTNNECNSTSVSSESYCHNVTSPYVNVRDENTALVTQGSKTRSSATNDESCKIVKWRGDNEYNYSEDSPIQPFKKSSKQMSRHALKYDIPMHLEDSYKKSYKSSDNGRRKKVEKIRSISNYYGYSSTDESTEYESPDEDWYYDPRRTSKWSWSNDYSSITTDNNSESTITDVPDYEYLLDDKNNALNTKNDGFNKGVQYNKIVYKDNYKTAMQLMKLSKERMGKKIHDVGIIKSDLYRTKANNLEHYDINDNTLSYYSHEVLGQGQQYLVAKTLESRTKSWEDVLQLMNEDEAEHECVMAKFVNSLTRSQAMEFSEVLSYISRIYVHGDKNPCNTLPSSYSELRNRYLDGRKSIAKHLPLPKVGMMKDHSYISINACIVDFLLKNKNQILTTKDWIEYYGSELYDANNLDLKNTTRIKIIVDKAIEKASTDNKICLPLFIKMWSDDFDPNRSVKANRQSLWLKTVTIFAFTTDSGVIEHTYPIGLSKKGVDHDEMDQNLLKELNHIKKAKPSVTMYSRSYKAEVSVYVDFFCIMNDQPERRKNLNLALGNSSLHKRMGYIMDYKQLVNVIRSCPRCTSSICEEFIGICIGKKRKKSYHWRKQTCKNCTSWLHNMESPLLSYKPDKSYPDWCIPPSGKIEPKVITREHVEEGIEFVHDGLILSKFKKNEAINFLRYYGLSGDAIDKIVTHGCNEKKYTEAYNNRKQEPDEYREIKEDYKLDKSKYQQWELPSSWFGENDTRLYVDVPMHLLFLGITKSCMIKATKWLTMKRMYSTFLSFTKKILDPIERMNLEWCKLMKYPTSEKFGGWVSENYLGMARACNWFYALMAFLPEQEEYEDPHPELPLKEWSKQQLRGWLDARGVPNKTGKVSELIESIQAYKDNDNEPDIINITHLKVHDILMMFNVLNKMISYMMSMQTTRDDIDKLESIIRAFLIAYDIVDKGLDYNKEEPSFMRQYNFLCLLNVPENMRQFGSMRNLWEGGIVGEGFLRGMKKELKQGMIGSWQVWTLKNILEKDLYADLILQKDKKIKGDFRLKVEKECIIHRTEEQAEKAYHSGEPISGLIINNNIDHLYILFRKKEKLGYKTVSINKSDGVRWHFHNYYRINIDDENDETLIKEDIENIMSVESITGALLLPKLFEEGYQTKDCNTMYCIIQSRWM